MAVSSVDQATARPTGPPTSRRMSPRLRTHVAMWPPQHTQYRANAQSRGKPYAPKNRSAPHHLGVRGSSGALKRGDPSLRLSALIGLAVASHTSDPPPDGHKARSPLLASRGLGRSHGRSIGQRHTSVALGGQRCMDVHSRARVRGGRRVWRASARGARARVGIARGKRVQPNPAIFLSVFGLIVSLARGPLHRVSSMCAILRNHPSESTRSLRNAPESANVAERR